MMSNLFRRNSIHISILLFGTVILAPFNGYAFDPSCTIPVVTKVDYLVHGEEQKVHFVGNCGKDVEVTSCRQRAGYDNTHWSCGGHFSNEQEDLARNVKTGTKFYYLVYKKGTPLEKCSWKWTDLAGQQSQDPMYIWNKRVKGACATKAKLMTASTDQKSNMPKKNSTTKFTYATSSNNRHVKNVLLDNRFHNPECKNKYIAFVNDTGEAVTMTSKARNKSKKWKADGVMRLCRDDVADANNTFMNKVIFKGERSGKTLVFDKLLKTAIEQDSDVFSLR